MNVDEACCQNFVKKALRAYIILTHSGIGISLFDIFQSE